MAVCNGELASSILQRLLTMKSQELWSLVEILACESMMHSQRLWSILQSPLRVENLIGHINTLSAEQKKLLVGRVALSLLRKICAFMEDDNENAPLHEQEAPKSHLGNRAPRNFNHKTIKISSWNEPASELCHTDAALVLLIVAEAHEQECKESVKKWEGDGRFLYVDEMKLSPRRYLYENILKMAYSVPGLMVDEVGLRSYIDLVCRYVRLLGLFMSESECESLSPPASAATILSLPSAIYTGEGSQITICSICGDALESRLSVASCLPCSHVYHWECIHSWLKTRNTCPLCRHELPTDDVFYEVARHLKCFM
ncbi:hypothetical protein SUGI_0050890 [Cryptomeria japonica]|uniref:E3 ubiquitin-protein ligase SGR9, amyloplastic n=1 Tax=Cryptomeria japonica TaxID=3369 RepID=UPI002408A659|nr:E3 ubiquitin-protein ligase SGR9, amyloplastic [Cryptomeria japonica]GLJ06870.1 hypothetical protein SUGI_0050890 [Cryptomeria japonica]